MLPSLAHPICRVAQSSEDIMASNDSSKSSSNNAGTKSGSGSSKSGTKGSSGAQSKRSNARSSARSGSSQSKGSNGNGGRHRGLAQQLSGWPTTVASLVGVGVALGFGLFASRRRWMPYADDVNHYLHDKWNDFSRSAGDDSDDDDDLFDDLYEEHDIAAKSATGSQDLSGGNDAAAAARVGL